MITSNQVIMTAQPEFTQAALAELQKIDPTIEIAEELAEDIMLCKTNDSMQLMRQAATHPPIFVRHLAPVQAVTALQHTEQDIGTLAIAVANLPTFAHLERGVHFAVQSRLLQSEEVQARPYSSGKLNQALATAIAEETGAIESIKKPQIVVSLLCTPQQGYLGISTVEENLSSWPGGTRRFAQTAEQISRAEFKLLEALDIFDISLPSEGRALDLGAAPGGWTRLLLTAGLSVVAVDPAKLSPQLTNNRNLHHYQGYTEQYLEEAIQKQQCFDMIVNDMRMDARDAARLLVQAATCLRAEGFIISVLKLPHTTRTMQPISILKEALDILCKQYRTVHARQLFHNRQEVTVVATHPYPQRSVPIKGGRHGQRHPHQHRRNQGHANRSRPTSTSHADI